MIEEESVRAIADLANDAYGTEVLNPEVADLYYVAHPLGSSGEVIDLEKFLARPRRKTGTVHFHDQASLAGYVKDQKPGLQNAEGRCRLYADANTYRIVAVLNDHDNEPNWGDYRAELNMRYTRHWQHWTARDNKLGTQVEFAEHIEEGLDEIVDPPAAEMLELAQNFYAHTKVQFRDANVLASGERSFVYIEEATASAGKTGQITVPQHFDLALAPFEGTNPYKVRARLRYRITGDGLRIGYKLERPDDVADAAFTDAIGWIESDTGLVALYGVR